jgi:lysophospholipase L1-like esterase
VEHWVFLGDSLTEGVGRNRHSYVSELVRNLRASNEHSNAPVRRVGYMRLKNVNPDSFNRFIAVNLAGLWDAQDSQGDVDLVVWNLGAEATTTADDMRWLPLLGMLNPQWVIVMRGALESIVRPPELQSGEWPWWLPRAWRGLASMDPRCYFSGQWWRVAKQRVVDTIKQSVRLGLLAKGGAPVHTPEQVFANYTTLLDRMKERCENIAVCGLLPVSEETFPGSASGFQTVNQGLQEIARSSGTHYVNWEELLGTSFDLRECLYRDGFHPNEIGNRLIGRKLSEHLSRIAGIQ